MRSHSRPTPAVERSAIVIVAVALLVAGCSTPDGRSTASVSAPVDATSTPPSPTSDPADDTVTAPDPCTVLPQAEITTALGIADAATPTATADTNFHTGQDAFGDFRDTSYCSLTLSEDARGRLGMSSEQGSSGLDLVLTSSAYNGSQYTSGGEDWSDTDPQGLLDTYLAANDEQIGSNPVAQRLSDTLIQDGSSAIATAGDRFWVQVQFFGCRPQSCGTAAVDLTRRLAAAVAATT